MSVLGVLIPYLLRHTLHDSKVIVGYTFAVMGFSGAIGALIASNMKMPRRRIRVMIAYWTIASLAGLAMASPPTSGRS